MKHEQRQIFRVFVVLMLYVGWIGALELYAWIAQTRAAELIFAVGTGISSTLLGAWAWRVLYPLIEQTKETEQ